MAKRYVVTSQVPDMEPNTAGTGFVNGWKVSYRVVSGPAMGTNGNVFVTEDQHNPDDVGSMIAAKLDQLDGIAQLGG